MPRPRKTREKAQVIRYYNDGWEINKIEEKVGVGRGTIYDWLHEEDVEMRLGKNEERDRKIYERYEPYGTPNTHDLAEEYDLTPERVRQIVHEQHKIHSDDEEPDEEDGPQSFDRPKRPS